MRKLVKGTKGQIVDLLLKGENTVEQICGELELSPTAVREHLYTLKSDSLVEEGEIREGPGRPEKLYSLSERGRELYPKGYAPLVVLLIEALEQKWGENRTREFLVSLLTDWFSEFGSLEEALRQMEATPEFSRDAEGNETLTLWNCPFRRIGQDNSLFCEALVDAFENLKGKRVSHEEKPLNGANVRVYTFHENEG